MTNLEEPVGGKGREKGNQSEVMGEKQSDPQLMTPDISPDSSCRPSTQIRGFEDLTVYQESYSAMMLVFKKVLPILPSAEKFDLYDQIKRASKAVPRLIAEGHSKRHQFRGFHKYIDDAKAESNELIVSISQVRDLYANQAQKEVCQAFIREYDKISRRLHNLACSWTSYHIEKRSNNRH